MDKNLPEFKISTIHSPTGSMWRRWDIHLHAPGTLHNDGFKGNWDGYFEAISKALPSPCALGVTDYFTLNCYKETIKRAKSGTNIWFFPNVELRLDISARNWINFHLIFSPEDEDHISKIESQLLKLQFKADNKETYLCSNESLIKLGRYHDPSQTDDRGALKAGALQFKARLDDIERILESPWVKDNVVTAVSGANGDGTAALRGASLELRKRIESLADIIFSGNEKDREYWLSPQDGRMPKPTIFSCDAHRNEDVLKPKNEKNCWIKGDVCFDTLKQVLLEPSRRVYIGKLHEPDPPPYAVINGIEVLNSLWFTNRKIPINSGLVAIIGARGSGKTALADLIALGAGVYEHKNSDSFIVRAREHLSELEVNLTWGGGETGYRLSDYLTENEMKQDVKYLSQHFVNRLCAHENQKELKKEIERIIFNSLEPANRQNTGSFSELESILLSPHRSDRNQTRSLIQSAHEKIIELTKVIDTQAKLSKQLDECKRSIDLKIKDIKRFIKNDSDANEASLVSAKLESVNKIIQEREDRKGASNRTLSRLDALSRDIDNEKQRIKLSIDRWKDEYSDIPFLKNLWRLLSF